MRLTEQAGDVKKRTEGTYYPMRSLSERANDYARGQHERVASNGIWCQVLHQALHSRSYR